MVALKRKYSDEYLILGKSLLKETVSGFLFWSIFHGFGPMIWYYPLNKLNFTGFEIFLSFMFSPALAFSTWGVKLMQDRQTVNILRILVLSGIASFQISSTFTRLLFLSLGMMASLLLLMIALWNISLYQRCVSLWGLILGMFALLVSRIWYTSLIPTWADSFSNIVVMAFGCMVLFDGIFSDSQDTISSFISTSKETSGWISTGIGFGSLLYLTHTLFGEVSVICRWVVKGYPNSGPHPNPWGAAVLFSLACGMVLSSKQYRGLDSWKWWATGSGGLLALYYLPSYMGFIGGLCSAVYIMSLWPVMITTILTYQPQNILTLGIAVYILEMLFSVWTIAYNFVPGGEYTRENTVVLIYFIIVSLGLSTCLGKEFKRNLNIVRMDAHQEKISNLFILAGRIIISCMQIFLIPFRGGI